MIKHLHIFGLRIWAPVAALSCVISIIRSLRSIEEASQT